MLAGILNGVTNKYTAIMVQNQLPAVDDEVLDMRWIARQDDWWLRTKRGWFWFDRRANAWKFSPIGDP